MLVPDATTFTCPPQSRKKRCLHYPLRQQRRETKKIGESYNNNYYEIIIHEDPDDNFDANIADNLAISNQIREQKAKKREKKRTHFKQLVSSMPPEKLKTFEIFHILTLNVPCIFESYIEL